MFPNYGLLGGLVKVNENHEWSPSSARYIVNGTLNSYIIDTYSILSIESERLVFS